MRANGGVQSEGCHGTFHHIVKQNVTGSARIACLCGYGDDFGKRAQHWRNIAHNMITPAHP